MPYHRNTQLKPSSKMLNLWLKLPKTIKLEIEELKTSARYTDVHSIIYLFILLTTLAIVFDFYIGLTVLTKSGISFFQVIVFVVFDIFFAIVGVFPYFNQGELKRDVFKCKIEMRTKKKTLTDTGLVEDTNEKHQKKKEQLYQNISKIKSELFLKGSLKLIIHLGIFGIAFWKIYQYYTILPEGLNIWSIPKGKMVIIMSLLTAVFHVMATESTLQYFRFILRLKKVIKEHVHNIKYNKEEETGSNNLKVPYVGHYNEYKCKRTDSTELIINENGQAQINYVNIIWDDEIMELINHQQDQNAKNGIMLTYLNTQF